MADLKILTPLSASVGVSVSGSAGLVIQQGGLTIAAGAGSTAVQALTATTISGSQTLQVGGTSTLAGNVTFGGDIVADADENKSIFAAVTSQTITVGAAGATVLIPGTASVGGNLTVTGDLTVNGTTTTINSTEITVDDKNIILGATASPTDTTANGGGITLSGSTNKTFQWVSSSNSWTSSEHLDLASGKHFKINGTQSLSIKASDFGGGALGTGSALTTGDGTKAIVTIFNSDANNEGIATVSASYAAQILAGQAFIQGGDAQLTIDNDATIFSMNQSSPSGAIFWNGPTHVAAVGANPNYFETASFGSFTALIDVSGALLSLDSKLNEVSGGLNNANGVSSTQYNQVRVAGTGSKVTEDDITFELKNSPGEFINDSGNIYRFPAVSGLSSSTAGNSGFQELMERLSYASFDVAVKASGSLTTWTNDLVSVTVSGSYDGTQSKWFPKFFISAPGLSPHASAKIRLIVVNEVSGALAL